MFEAGRPKANKRLGSKDSVEAAPRLTAMVLHYFYGGFKKGFEVIYIVIFFHPINYIMLIIVH